MSGLLPPCVKRYIVDNHSVNHDCRHDNSKNHILKFCLWHNYTPFLYYNPNCGKKIKQQDSRLATLLFHCDCNSLYLLYHSEYFPHKYFLISLCEKISNFIPNNIYTFHKTEKTGNSGLFLIISV